jgi:hypothetical protein
VGRGCPIVSGAALHATCAGSCSEAGVLQQAAGSAGAAATASIAIGVNVSGAVGAVPQQALATPSPPRSGATLQTPVSGRTSSTRRAASQSPASAATIERTCS